MSGLAMRLRQRTILVRLAFLILASISIGCRVRSETRGIAIDSLTYRDADLVPRGILSSRPDMDSFATASYSQQLSALHEGRLAYGIPYGTHEAYRFVWLRSFHHPVVVRIYSSRAGAVAVTSEGAGQSGYAPGPVTRRDSVVLSERDWLAFRDLIDRERLWDRPGRDDSPPGLDGAGWVVEGRRDSRYTLVYRWSPTDSDSSAFMRALGLAFIRIGHVVVPPDEVY